MYSHFYIYIIVLYTNIIFTFESIQFLKNLTTKKFFYIFYSYNDSFLRVSKIINKEISNIRYQNIHKYDNISSNIELLCEYI